MAPLLILLKAAALIAAAVHSPPLRRPESGAKTEQLARVLEVYRSIDMATKKEEERRELRSICARESWCNRYGVQRLHRVDEWMGRRQWARAVKQGHLDPQGCPEHELGDPARWSTRGPFGISSAYSLRFVAGCHPPEILDSPKAAAIAAVGFIDRLKQIGAKTCKGRARWWAGPGIWAKKTEIEKLRSEHWHCGPVLPERYLLAAIMDKLRQWEKW